LSAKLPDAVQRLIKMLLITIPACRRPKEKPAVFTVVQVQVVCLQEEMGCIT
jgi:hypothetical protein